MKKILIQLDTDQHPSSFDAIAAYDADGAHMIGQYVVDDGTSARRAGVLVCHEGPGLTEHTKKIAARLASLGYAAFAMDYHGDGKPIANPADMRSRIGAWMADPTAQKVLGRQVRR